MAVQLLDHCLIVLLLAACSFGFPLDTGGEELEPGLEHGEEVDDTFLSHMEPQEGHHQNAAVMLPNPESDESPSENVNEQRVEMDNGRGESPTIGDVDDGRGKSPAIGDGIDTADVAALPIPSDQGMQHNSITPPNSHNRNDVGEEAHSGDDESASLGNEEADVAEHPIPMDRGFSYGTVTWLNPQIVEVHDKISNESEISLGAGGGDEASFAGDSQAAGPVSVESRVFNDIVTLSVLQDRDDSLVGAGGDMDESAELPGLEVNGEFSGTATFPRSDEVIVDENFTISANNIEEEMDDDAILNPEDGEENPDLADHPQTIDRGEIDGGFSIHTSEETQSIDDIADLPNPGEELPLSRSESESELPSNSDNKQTEEHNQSGMKIEEEGKHQQGMSTRTVTYQTSSPRNMFTSVSPAQSVVSLPAVHDGETIIDRNNTSRLRQDTTVRAKTVLPDQKSSHTALQNLTTPGTNTDFRSTSHITSGEIIQNNTSSTNENPEYFTDTVSPSNVMDYHHDTDLMPSFAASLTVEKTKSTPAGTQSSTVNTKLKQSSKMGSIEFDATFLATMSMSVTSSSLASLVVEEVLSSHMYSSDKEPQWQPSINIAIVSKPDMSTKQDSSSLALGYTDHSQRSSTDHSQHSSTDHSQRSSTDHSQRSSTDHSQRSSTDHSQHSSTDHSQHTSTDRSQRSSTDHSQHSSTDHSQHSSTYHSQRSSTDHSQHSTTDHSQHPSTDHSQHTSTKNIYHTSTEHVQYTSTDSSQHTSTDSSQHTSMDHSQHTWRTPRFALTDLSIADHINTSISEQKQASNTDISERFIPIDMMTQHEDGHSSVIDNGDGVVQTSIVSTPTVSTIPDSSTSRFITDTNIYQGSFVGIKVSSHDLEIDHMVISSSAVEKSSVETISVSPIKSLVTLASSHIEADQKQNSESRADNSADMKMYSVTKQFFYTSDLLSTESSHATLYIDMKQATKVDTTSIAHSTHSVLHLFPDDQGDIYGEVNNESDKPSLFIHLTFRMTTSQFCFHRSNLVDDVVRIMAVTASVRRQQVVLINSCQGMLNTSPSQIIDNVQVQLYLQNLKGHPDARLTSDCAKIILSGFDTINGTYFKDKLVKVKLVEYRSTASDPFNASNTSSTEHSSHGGMKEKTIQYQHKSVSTLETGITVAIAIASVGGICCIVVIILQLMLHRKHGRKMHVYVPSISDRFSIPSLDSIALASVTKDRPHSGFWNPGLEDDLLEHSHSMNYVELSNYTLDTQAMYEEFQSLPNEMPSLSTVPRGAEDKNRYANVIAIPGTRVKLKKMDNEDGSDYIHANFVTGYQMDNRAYIATQAPLHNTFTDFWQMVWEQQARTILMLTAMNEHGQPRCSQYWPDDDGLDTVKQFGDFSVVSRNKEVHQTYIMSVFELKDIENNLLREVHHFWFTCWPMNKTPEPLSLVKFLLDTRPHYEDSGAPVIVHCSPGTGRTGTLIALDICMRMFEDKRRTDVLRCLHDIRLERAGAVQNKDQYLLLYTALHKYATVLNSPSISTSSSAVTLHAML